ncbi:MAG TPA: hypothetical protein VK982_04625, partial [Bacteroidales bacterium]|nr:hypothetical protein [Bacteroidales bacterium]
CIPYVKTGGYFIALKGNNYQEEINLSNNALKLLAAEIEEVFTYELSKDYGSRSLIKVRKRKDTDRKYPRRYSRIKKQHL